MEVVIGGNGSRCFFFKLLPGRLAKLQIHKQSGRAWEEEEEEEEEEGANLPNYYPIGIHGLGPGKPPCHTSIYILKLRIHLRIVSIYVTDYVLYKLDCYWRVLLIKNKDILNQTQRICIGT